MKKSKIAYLAALTLLIPTISLAQNIQNIVVSNNSNFPVSFWGDTESCIGQTGPHTVNVIPADEFTKLCKSANCTTKIYANYSCANSYEYAFDLNLSYGVGQVGSNYPYYIRVEGYQNYIFVTNKNS